MADRRFRPVNSGLSPFAKAEDITISGAWTYTSQVTLKADTSATAQDVLSITEENDTELYYLRLDTADNLALYDPADKIAWQVVDADPSLRIRDGYTLRVYDSGDTDYLDISHNGTNLINAHVNTTSHVMQDLTRFELQDGAGLRIFDSGNTDYLTLSHDGTDVQWEHNNTAYLRIRDLTSGILCYSSGSTFEQRWYDSGVDDSIRIRHDGNWGTLDLGNNTASRGIRIRPATSGVRAAINVSLLSAADDATTTLATQHGGGIYMIVGSNSTIAQANDIYMGYWQNTTTHGSIFDVASGTISRGTGSNPDVDGDNNIWFTNSGQTLNIKNRRGSVRYYNVFIIGGDA